jgi:hypothetical protein
MVEISLDDHMQSETSTPLLITYSTLTCLLVSVHLLALMISTCIIPLLESNHTLSDEDLGTMHIYIEFAWILSTGFGEKLSCFFLFGKMVLFISLRNIFIPFGNHGCMLGEIFFYCTSCSDRVDGYYHTYYACILYIFIAFLSTYCDTEIKSSSK